MTPEFSLDELETPRLRLRKLAIYDAAQLELLRLDERVNRYLDSLHQLLMRGSIL